MSRTTRETKRRRPTTPLGLGRRSCSGKIGQSADRSPRTPSAARGRARAAIRTAIGPRARECAGRPCRARTSCAIAERPSQSRATRRAAAIRHPVDGPSRETRCPSAASAQRQPRVSAHSAASAGNVNRPNVTIPTRPRIARVSDQFTSLAARASSPTTTPIATAARRRVTPRASIEENEPPAPDRTSSGREPRKQSGAYRPWASGRTPSTPRPRAFRP